MRITVILTKLYADVFTLIYDQMGQQCWLQNNIFKPLQAQLNAQSILTMFAKDAQQIRWMRCKLQFVTNHDYLDFKWLTQYYSPVHLYVSCLPFFKVLSGTYLPLKKEPTIKVKVNRLSKSNMMKHSTVDKFTTTRPAYSNIWLSLCKSVNMYTVSVSTIIKEKRILKKF